MAKRMAGEDKGRLAIVLASGQSYLARLGAGDEGRTICVLVGVSGSGRATCLGECFYCYVALFFPVSF